MALTKPQGNMVMKLGTEAASTSGTSVTFTGIPAGTTMIVVMLQNVSTNGAGGIRVRIGPVGGVATTGYVSSGMTTNATESVTSGFIVTAGSAAASNWNGAAIIFLADATNNDWVANLNFTEDGGTQDPRIGSGRVTISGVLSAVSVHSDDTFDAGAVNIAYF